MFTSCYSATLASNTAHRPQRLSVLDCAQFRKRAMMPAPCRYTQVQNNTQQKERQFLTSAPTRAPCARENAERRFRPEDSRYARDWLASAPKTARRPLADAGRAKGFRRVLRYARNLTRFRHKRQRGPAWRVQMARKVEGAYFGTRRNLRAPAGPPDGPAASSSFAGC